MKKAVIITALVLAALTAPPAGAQGATKATEATVALSAILSELHKEGALDGIIEEIAGFVSNYPDSKVTDEALIVLADIYIGKNKFKKACGAYSRILHRFPASRFRSRALFGLGHCQYRDGLMKEARTALRSVLHSQGATLGEKVRAAAMVRTIDAVGTSPWREPGDVALTAILPLKGKYAKFGEAALKGVLLAARVFGEGQGGEGQGESGDEGARPAKGRLSVEVKIKDLSSMGPDAPEGMLDVTDDPRVAAIVGPMLSRTATLVADRAQEEGVPMIALTQKEAVQETGDYVFRNFLTPKQQAESIADYSYDIIGLEKFAVLSPSNRYGSELARNFKEHIQRIGGEMVAEMSYKPGQEDFAEEMEFLFGIEVKERVVGRRHIREFTPSVKIDGLYIPDYPDAVAQIAPYLAYYNITDVQLLGSNGWNSPRLLKLAGEHVEGAVFVDGFYAWSERPGTREFIESFRSVYGHRPGVIEAQAFDATMMLLEAIDDGGGERDAVRSALESLYGFEGATGILSFDYSGEASKDLFILTVKDGRISEVY